MNTTLFYIAILLYFASTAGYLLYLSVNRAPVERTGHYLLVSAFVVHIISTLVRYLEAGYTPITNLHESLSFFALSIAAVFLFLKGSQRTAILGAIILPVIAVVLAFSSALPAEIRPLPPVLRSFWLPIHTVFAFLGNAAFALAFFVSIVYLAVERSIKKKRLPSMSERLPSLETLDSLNYRCISIGFPFLTAGIVTGSFWAGLAWGSYWSWDPKETFSLITWIVYAILLHNRLVMGWRGRRTAFMLIVGFFFTLVTFLGVNLLIGGMHAYV